MEKIPAIYLTHLTQAQKKAYRIADNRLTENGEWDIDLLKLELKDIEQLDLNLNLDLTGFDNQEIDVLFNPPVPAKQELNNIPYTNLTRS